MGHDALSLEKGVGRAILATLRGWVTLFYYEDSLNANETVKHTCFIKHSHLELLLKVFSNLLCEKMQGATGRISIPV